MVDKVSNVANNSENYSSFSKTGQRQKITLRETEIALIFFLPWDVHHGYISYLVYWSDLALTLYLSDCSLAINQKQETTTRFQWELDVKPTELNFKVFQQIKKQKTTETTWATEGTEACLQGQLKSTVKRMTCIWDRIVL